MGGRSRHCSRRLASWRTVQGGVDGRPWARLVSGNRVFGTAWAICWPGTELRAIQGVCQSQWLRDERSLRQRHAPYCRRSPRSMRCMRRALYAPLWWCIRVHSWPCSDDLVTTSWANLWSSPCWLCKRSVWPGRRSKQSKKFNEKQKRLVWLMIGFTPCLPCRRTPRPCTSSSATSCCAAPHPHRPCRGPWYRKSNTTACSPAQWPPLCDVCVRRWLEKCLDFLRNWDLIRWASLCPCQWLHQRREKVFIDFPCEGRSLPSLTYRY